MRRGGRCAHNVPRRERKSQNGIVFGNRIATEGVDNKRVLFLRFLRGKTRNQAYVQAYRGFESHPVRHGILRASDFSGALCFTVSRANSYSNKHGTLMWLIIHVLIIAGLSVRVLLRPRRDPASRIAWILFIMALPYVGAFAYLMLGEVRPEKLAGRPGAPKRLAMAESERYVQSAVGALPGFSLARTIDRKS